MRSVVTPRQIRTACRLYRAGHGLAATAQAVGLHPQTLVWHLRLRGIMRTHAQGSRTKHSRALRRRWYLTTGWKTTRYRRYTFQGTTLTRADWAARLGITPATLKTRLRRGWTKARALTQLGRSVL